MIEAGIIQPLDYAGTARQGFEYGQQKRREMDTDKALNALMANPEDPNAIQMLGQADPSKGLVYQQHIAEKQKVRAKELTEVFGRAARAAKTPQQWDALATWLSQNGIPGAANVVGKFTPEMRAGYMAQAGLEDDAQDPTSMQRNFEFLKQIDPKLADQYLHGQAEGPPIVANNGDGTFTIVPRNMAHQGGAPQSDDEWEYAPPANGGQTAPPSGGFLGP
jgi:hypothetical protein